MINYPAVYIANGSAIVLSLIILLSSKSPLHRGLLDEKIYFAMVTTNIVQCVLETLTFLLDGKIEYSSLLLVINVFLFSNTVVFGYAWVIYADYKLFTDKKRIKRVYPIIAIPFILVVIGCLINLVTPVFFHIDQYGIYHRTKLFVFPYIVTYFYMAYGTGLIYYNRKKVNKYLFMPAILFKIPILLGSLLQFIFYGYALVWLGVSIGLTSLFINVQNEASYIDPLSGLFNRLLLTRVLYTYCEYESSTLVPAGIMLDIDNFKSINDKFGHVVGDDAISTIGRLLISAVGDKGEVFRYGGDEFIILMMVSSEKDVLDMIDNIKTKESVFNASEEKPYELNFSIGYGMHDRQRESMDDFLNKIDNAMYEDKRRRVCEGIIPERR